MESTFIVSWGPIFDTTGRVSAVSNESDINRSCTQTGKVQHNRSTQCDNVRQCSSVSAYGLDSRSSIPSIERGISLHTSSRTHPKCYSMNTFELFGEWGEGNDNTGA
jgi:hypothetical protein